MRASRTRLATLAAAALAAAGGVFFTAGDVTSAPKPSGVFVTNGADAPVPTSVVGTPTVQVGGTATVQLAGTPAVSVAGPVTVTPTREPFQQYVTGSSSGSENCDALEVPEGKRLVLESVAVDAHGSAAPRVYVRVVAAYSGGASFVRPVQVELKPADAGWAGVADVLLHSGQPAPGARTFTLDVCVLPASGAASGSYRGFASGWLEDA